MAEQTEREMRRRRREMMMMQQTASATVRKRRPDKEHKAAVSISDRILRTLSRKVVQEWEELATYLDFDNADIKIFKRDNPQDIVQQIYTMLTQWRQNQPASVNQTDALCMALKEVRRADLAIMLREYHAKASPGILENWQSTQQEPVGQVNEEWTSAFASQSLYACCQWKVLLCVVTSCVLSVALLMFILGVNPNVFFVGTLEQADERQLSAHTQRCHQLSIHPPTDAAENQPSPSFGEPPTPPAAVRSSPAQIAADGCEDALKSHFRSDGSYVQMIPWIDDDKMHIMDIYTKLHLEYYGANSLNSYEDIFTLQTREGDPVKRAVFNGLAGRGKSTLLDKMAYDWALGNSNELNKFKLVILLRMHALEQTSELTEAIFDQLLDQDTSIEKDALEMFIRNNPDRVLILLDAFDELMTASLNATAFGSILKILNRKMCRECFVVVSTRPSHLDRLVTDQLIREPFTHLKVFGFLAEDISDYVYKFYSEEHDKAKGLLVRIKSSDVLSNLAESPMLLLLMSLLWREDSTLPETMSRLYSEAVNYIFKRKVDVSLEEISKVVIEIGKIGLHGLLPVDQVLSFKESEFEKNVLDMALKVGLLTRKKVRKRLDTHNSIRFVHKTFQEFCAAKYLQSLIEADIGEFQKTLDQIATRASVGVEYLLRFCSGDNEVCTNAILKLFQRWFQEGQVHESLLRTLVLQCYFEGQSKVFLSEELVHAVVTEDMILDCVSIDSLFSFTYFLQSIAVQTTNRGVAYLAKVQTLMVGICDLERYGARLLYPISVMSNLQTLTLSSCSLIASNVGDIVSSLSNTTNVTQLRFFDTTGLSGTAGSWSHHLRCLKGLQQLDLSLCSLVGEDVQHIAESLSNLTNFTTLILSANEYLSESAATWSSHLKNLKHLQMLDVSECSLRGESVAHITESLRDLPSLVDLSLSRNKHLSGSAALWSSHLKDLKHLEKLDLSRCSLTGRDMAHITESLRDLPNLTELQLSNNHPMSGSASLWSSQLKPLKHLEKLDLGDCTLTGNDLTLIIESLSNLPNQAELRLAGNENLGGSIPSWAVHLKHMKRLQKLDLSDCSLGGEDVLLIVESLCDLPNLVELRFMSNENLGGSGALWSSHLKQLKHLEKLDLGGCSLTAEDKELVSKSLSDLHKINGIIMW